ncbi:hypothetical protein BGW38_009828 [Lunasporangiospora selenospora]|uniref:Secreted protein n=1 Tax=Lunasporangiospora selenospora TaxID=979761 RepID=A0A9P6KF58_9FUNG|nr:hypothetical protein BGW38_009828 [Lunasporangiospora selenospora]
MKLRLPALALGLLFISSSASADLLDQCTLVNDSAAALCNSPVCASESITLVQNTIAQNCVNASDPTTRDLVYGAASLYPPFREGLCQQVPSTPGQPANGTYCVAVMAESMAAYLAKNPTPLGIKIFTDSEALKAYVNSMPKELLCSDCNKAMINPLANYVRTNQSTLNAGVQKWARVIETEVETKCGRDFTNGLNPTNPSTGSQNQKSLAVSTIAAVPISGAAWVIGATAWTLLG